MTAQTIHQPRKRTLVPGSIRDRTYKHLMQTVVDTRLPIRVRLDAAKEAVILENELPYPQVPYWGVDEA